MNQPAELRLVHSVQDRFFPDAAFADFRKAVLEDGAKPSETVRALMAKYRCPEPDAYAMMLAGLAGLGFMARRKKAISLK